HHDFAPYNVALTSSSVGECVVGVYDWDMAGPGVPLDDLAFAAWNWVPLHRDVGAETSARRLEIMAAAYGGDLTAYDMTERVVLRIDQLIAGIAAGQAAGDQGMLNLANVGEPARTTAALGGLRRRMPSIRAALLTGSS
nr:phosphotransferase [Propionibacteriales bacterium]